MIKVKPIGDRVLIKPGTIEQMTESGLVLPQGAQVQLERVGTVVDIGEGEMTVEGRKAFTTIQPGSRVYYFEGMGMKVRVGAENLLMLAYQELLGVVSE